MSPYLARANDDGNVSLTTRNEEVRTRVKQSESSGQSALEQKSFRVPEGADFGRGALMFDRLASELSLKKQVIELS